MALSEKVKAQARAATSSPLIRAYLRLYSVNGSSVLFNSGPAGDDGFAAAVLSQRSQVKGYDQTPPKSPMATEPGVMTDDIHQQARDAVAQKVSTAQIRLIAHNGSLSPIGTPSMGQTRIARRIARLQGMTLNTDQQHRELTRDGFGKE